jgi:hypothetical protein
MQVFEIPARFVLGLYLVWDNLLPFFLAGRSGGVAHGAHIGGFIVGGLAAWFMGRGAAALAEARFAGQGGAARGADAVAKAIEDGRFREAAEAYFALPSYDARGALSPDEAVALGSWLRANGHADAALDLLQRVMSDAARQPGIGEVAALAGLILLQDARDAPAAYQYLVTALELGASPQTQAAVRRALQTIDALQKRSVGRPHTPRPW